MILTGRGRGGKRVTILESAPKRRRKRLQKKN
ncbi:hypothetical protein GCK32_022222 [Trichostrongylus colubriformis]|uniref:Uncharacterized protein n=1 Tax=Trichostrongylus colubriformis TaxID=6319 RepID=A0AAN8F7G8_TRICO